MQQLSKHPLYEAMSPGIFIRVVFCLLIVSGTVQAHQFRSLQPIASPTDQQQAVDDHGLNVEQIEPIERGVVENMVSDIISKWNTPEMAGTLADTFFDKDRLLDSVDNIVPRDAKLRLQSIRGVQTVQQYIEPGQAGERGQRVSIVSVTVQTQLEFNDPTQGFVRRSGTNELILKVSEPAL
ncbi:MAG: hypothetical protein MI673_03370 [Thiotrichales bacterium]|nr:hypothetical protein [Thiotrichales bacterium]